MNDKPFAVLRTELLTKRYGRRAAVDHLSLEVERGDIFGFLGQNGAGKSTTIRMVLGLVRPSQGNVRLLGQDMRRHPLRALRHVGAIIESPAFYDHFTGWQNLRLFAAMSGGATRARIDEVLDIVGLTGRAHEPVRVYSHGMRQRLGIAQALLPAPKFIILDEPTDGLDPQGIREVRLLIRRLRDELDLTVLLSSHLLNEVEQICNRVAIIDHGRLLYQGTIEKLVTANKTVRLRVDRLDEAYSLLSTDPALAVSRNGDGALYVRMADEQIPRVNALLVARGFLVSELSPQRETLEQVFLRLTETTPENNSRINA
ncbi:MAG TPA: ABC transporter ATP-binding protein [Pyrinomonadaceae bacterium]|jgi:ABC-2 type transport system ATP-binding protein|nr:ABC transporter ATP-binding protein [Pyrinomonadaceae bacterium]